MKKNKLFWILILVPILYFYPIPANADPISFIVAFATAFAATGAVGGIVAGYVLGVITYTALVAGIIFGGQALMGGSKRSSGISASPTYSAATTQTQTNNRLPIPMIYGEVKLAGNRIYQGDNATGNIRRLVAFGDGEIEDFTDIRLNDILYTKISGCTVTKYLGTPTQTISNLVTEGDTNAERAEVVGSLKNLAYLAVKVPASQKISGDYNLTTVVKGRKIKVYTDEDTYTTVYNNNPVWCCLDLLTSYNGQRIGMNNLGIFDNNELKKKVDINSFIEAADYCDELITYYKYQTDLTGANNDLIWLGRKSNRLLTLTYVAGSTPAVTISGDDITVTFVNGVTTASDIISLVQTTPSVNDVVKVYNADNNDGTGVVIALAKTDFIVDTSEKRYTFNMVFDSDWIVRDAIEEFKKNCNGVLAIKDGKLQFKIDKAEIVTKVFNKSDIIQGSETVTTIPLEQRFDMMDIKYISPSNVWAEVTARAELDAYVNEPAVKHEIDILSITNFRQAARLAWHYLNRNVRCYFTGSFATNYKASDLEVGDVIQLNDFVMNFTNFPVKVQNITNDNGGVFTIQWQQYDSTIYTDELGSLEPIIIDTNINNPYALPDDVQNFSVVQNKTLYQFSWTPVEGTDIYYEIRQGSTWDSGILVADNILNTQYSSIIPQIGSFTFWIKAKTIYNYCENPTSDTVNVQFIPSLNEVISLNILQNAVGAFDGTYAHKNRLFLRSANKWTNRTPDKWTENVLDRDYANPVTGKWTYKTLLTGTYYSDVKDIGGILENIISYDYEFNRTDDDASCTLEFRISDDNITFTDWKPMLVGQMTFRYIQFRITLNSPNQTPVNLYNFMVNIDVPDREENYTNREITNATNGITITFETDSESRQPKPFIINEPHIIATPKTNSSMAVVTASTPTSCTVKLYNNSGTLITGFVNITAKGY